MPHSKKGRLAGGQRKEINESRAADAIAVAFMSEAERTRKGTPLDFVFGRVTKMTGANHVRVAIATKRGSREILARIPNIFTRRGATPINDRTVVSIYTGPDYDPDAKSDEKATEHYDIAAILSDRQVSDLRKAGLIPDWMTSLEAGSVGTGKKEEILFEWTYDDGAKKTDDAAEPDSGAAAGAGAGTGFSRSAARYAPAADEDSDDFNIDDI
jgi:hypothetical protein